jgi:hypothetical protein
MDVIKINRRASEVSGMDGGYALIRSGRQGKIRTPLFLANYCSKDTLMYSLQYHTYTKQYRISVSIKVSVFKRKCWIDNQSFSQRVLSPSINIPAMRNITRLSFKKEL